MIWSSLNFGKSSKSRLNTDGSRLKLVGNSDLSTFDVVSPRFDVVSPTFDFFDVSVLVSDDDDNDDDDVPMWENSSSNFSHILLESSII